MTFGLHISPSFTGGYYSVLHHNLVFPDINNEVIKCRRLLALKDNSALKILLLSLRLMNSCCLNNLKRFFESLLEPSLISILNCITVLNDLLLASYYSSIAINGA